MRYVTAVVRPVENVHPTIRAIASTDGLTLVAIQQTRLLDDGTEVTLSRVRGEIDHLREVLDEVDAVRDFAVAGERDGLVYSHSEPHETARWLLDWRTEYELVVQMPVRFTGDGGLRLTVLGEDETFQRAFDDLDTAFEVEIEATGEYHPDVQHLFSTLTDRQQEILRTAIRDGYYEVPRKLSQRDIANDLDLAPATVSQHLRRIESRVFSEYVLEGDDAGGAL